MDPGKGSKRRPGNSEAYAENYEKIFGKKEIKPGRRYYRWNPETRKFDKVDNPPAPLPREDLRFDGTFRSPVDGSRIASRTQLLDHNKKHGVEQVLPGMEQDQARIRQENLDRAFGKKAKEERIEAVKAAIENPVIKERPVYDGE